MQRVVIPAHRVGDPGRERELLREHRARRGHVRIHLQGELLRIASAAGRELHRVRPGKCPRSQRDARRVPVDRRYRIRKRERCRWRIVDIPYQAMHPRRRRHRHRRTDPVVGHVVLERRQRLVVARVAAHQLAVRVEYLDGHRTGSIRAEVVVDDRAVRRILARRFLLRHRRIGVVVPANTVGGGRLKEMGARCGHLRARLPKRRHVIEYPEGTSVRSHHQVVLVYHQIPDRSGRHVLAQRLPVPAIIERNPDLVFRACVQQSLPLRILANDVDDRAVGEPVRDQRPALPAVVRAVDVRPQVIQAERVHGGVRGACVEVRGVQHGDLAPRPLRELGRRDVAPCLSAVARDLYESIIGSNPDHAGVQVRRTDGVDDSPMLPLLGIETGEHAEIFRNVRGSAREVGADLRPARAAGGGLPEHVRREVQRVRIHRREEDRLRAHHPEIIAAATQRRRYVLRLPRAPVEARHLAAINDVRIERVGSDVAVFLDTHRIPLSVRDLAVRSAAPDAHRPALLLAAAHPVREAVVGGDVVELCRRLIVPGTPRLPAVHGDDHALVGGEDDDLRISRVDPRPVVVVAPGGATECREGPAAVGRLPRHDVRHVQYIGIGGIDAHLVEVAITPPETRVVIHQRPALARIVGAIHPRSFPSAHHGVENARIARRYRDSDAAQFIISAGKPIRDLLPRGAAVGGFVQPVLLRERPRASHLPRRLASGPHHREHRLRIGRVDCHIDSASVLIRVQHALKIPAAICRAIDPALLVGPVRMSQHGHEQAVGVSRIHVYRRDLLAVAQTEMRPRIAAVARPVHAIARREVGALQSLAASDVEHLRIRRRDGDRADRPGRLIVEDRRPHPTVVGGLPHAAVVHPYVEHVRLIRNPDCRHCSTAAVRPDHSPPQLREKRRIELLRAEHRARRRRCDRGQQQYTRDTNPVQHDLFLGGQRGQVLHVEGQSPST